MTEQYIEMLLDNYESMRDDSSTNSSPSSETPDLPGASRLSKKLVLPPQRYASLPPCKGAGCGSPDVIEDVSAGSVVCTQCGLIQSMYVFESARTSAIFHEGVSRTVGHRYSRIAYLRGVLKSLQGDTHIELLQQEMETLRLYFLNVAPPPNGFAIKKAILHLKLPPKLLYHAHSIAFRLFRAPTPNPSEGEIRDVLRLFRVLENAWDRLPLGSSVRKGRKKFLAYTVVWEQLCIQLGFSSMANLLPPLKNKKLREKQLLVFDQLVDLINK